MQIFACGNFCSVCFVRDTNAQQLDEDVQKELKTEEETTRRLQALSELIQQNADSTELELIGVNTYRGDLLKTINPKRLPAMEAYYLEKVPATLRDYCKQHDNPQLYHIQFMATDPKQRNKGLATQCMDYLLKAADAEHKHCAIEVTNETVKSMLKDKWGFEEYRTIETGIDGPVVAIMTREPRTALRTPET